MKSNLTRLTTLFAGLSMAGYAANISFNTFVSSGSLDAGYGGGNHHDTIGFTYAGDKFVGTIYNFQSGDNRQLYSTNLSGGGVAKFGTALPTGAGEIVVAGSLGQAGFAPGSVYAGTTDIGGSNGIVYSYSDIGGAPTAFATGLVGNVRGMLFDPGSSFGGNLLVSTDAGRIYSITSAGVASQIANLGTDAEGMDIIPVGATGWGSLGGSLVVASEGSNQMYVVSPGGAVNVATGVNISIFESINFVPEDIGLSGNPLEGYYAANFQVDIQKANASQFLSQGLGGHLLATSEFGSNSSIYDIKYTGTGFNFTQTTYNGVLPNQAEDGIFVSAQRLSDASTPEPGSVLTITGGLVALLAVRRRRLARQ